MQESFLHYVWQYQYYARAELTTTTGQTVSILLPGLHNRHAGPDFSDSKIMIDSVLWVGTVEIHVYSSDWLRHQHHFDPAYQNVILHVVWEQDKPIQREDGSLLPTLELKKRIDPDLILRFTKLFQSPAPIPCSRSFYSVPSIVRFSALDKSVVDRLQAKADRLLDLLNRNQNDWHETVYQQLGQCFGFKVNAEPFFQLVRSIPYKMLSRHLNNQIQVEALLFGQAGFLTDDLGGPYPMMLKREYELLAHKYQTKSGQLNKAQWRFLRLRPANFPTLRIAQFASLLCTMSPLLARLLDAGGIKDLDDLFSVQQSLFWRHHYSFDAEEKEEVPDLGLMSRQSIIVNLVVPLYAAYACYKDEASWMDRAVRLLQQLPPEVNSVTKKWSMLGERIGSAFDSQGYIQLYSQYCLKKRCLDCNIGAAIVRTP